MHLHYRSQTYLPWEICTSVTKRSLRGNLCGMAARSAMPLMMASQCAANSSGRSRPRTTSDGTVRMMFSNSSSAQGEGAVRSRDQLAAVVSPEGNKRMGVFKTEHSLIRQLLFIKPHSKKSTNQSCQELHFQEHIFTMPGMTS